MNITAVEKFFEFFYLCMHTFVKHKLPIMRWVLLFHKETFYKMFEASVSATLIQRVTWYIPFRFIEKKLITLYS